MYCTLTKPPCAYIGVFKPPPGAITASPPLGGGGGAYYLAALDLGLRGSWWTLKAVDNSHIRSTKSEVCSPQVDTH